MRTIYNILFSIFFWLSSPYYFLRMWRRGNWHEGFGERLGKYPTRVKSAITNGHVIWIHAVSVGEVNVCTQLIKALEPRVPNARILVSTTTTTGMGELQRKLPSRIVKIFYPFDFRKCVQRAVGTIHPEAVILVEAEIWPNFLWRVRERNIPLFLVNARLSERSFRGYKRFGFIFRSIFQGFTGIGAQTEADAQRLKDIGARPEAVHVVGSLKYDAVQIGERILTDIPRLLKRLGVPEDAQILIGGSTHAGEETILAEIAARLRAKFPRLFLILVPRHFERGRAVGDELKKIGVKFMYRSEVTNSVKLAPGSLECLLVNTTGELKSFYEYATVVFVGKSLTAEGGQSPIEPAGLAKPMVFGPKMQNFAAIVNSFLTQKGALQVANAAELETEITRLLANPALRLELGRNALRVVKENQGAIERTVDMICDQLHDSDIFVAPPTVA